MKCTFSMAKVIFCLQPPLQTTTCFWLTTAKLWFHLWIIERKKCSLQNQKIRKFLHKQCIWSYKSHCWNLALKSRTPNLDTINPPFFQVKHWFSNTFLSDSLRITSRRIWASISWDDWQDSDLLFANWFFELSRGQKSA